MRAKQRIIFIICVTILVFGVVRGDNEDHHGHHDKNNDDDDGHNADGLKMNFYKKSCPQVEDLVGDIIKKKAQSDPLLGAKMLRLHYHDCFVRGCDASILLDPVNNTPAEKAAIPNQSLLGFEVIDDIKTEMEQICPGVVSCADILALAARDAVSIPFERPLWDVLTGRRDGKTSLASEVIGNLPSPFSDFNTLMQIFVSKGFGIEELVVLSGAHTIGIAHCGSFSKRLYNFTGKDDADPSLDATYAEFLKTQCPKPANQATTVEMDPQSSLSFDNHYYDNLLQNKGLFQSDSALLTNRVASRMVRQLSNKAKPAFFNQFGRAMKKMGSVEVLTGNAGEIRKQCRIANS